MKRRDFLAAGSAAAALGLVGRAGGQSLPEFQGKPLAGSNPPQPVDNSGRIIPPPARDYWPYSGISGPGTAATDASASGGWTSGMPSVRYKGPVPRHYPVAPWGDSDAATAVKAGLLPPIRPIHDVHIRDTIVCLGGDGYYYLTGSTGDNIWAINDGVELWRSKDLSHWDYLGLVWSIEKDGTWQKDWRMRAGVPFRALWAPEIHFIHGNYYITSCISRAGSFILKSSTGRAEGPYVHAFSPEKPIRGGIDPTLFEDDDGAVWFTAGSADEIVRLKSDMSGLAGDWQKMTATEWDLDPKHHHGNACTDTGCRKFGYEGATMFKRNGVYYLGVVDRYEGRYSFRIWMSDKPTGPWREPHEGAPCCGGGNIMKDRQGRWWQTHFGNDDASPYREKPGMVRIDFDAAGKVVVHKDQPFALSPAAWAKREKQA